MRSEALDAIEWDELLLPAPPPEAMPAELETRVRFAFTYVPPWIRSLMWSPWVLRAMLDGIIVKSENLGPELIALLRLVIAQDNSCRYCYGTARMFLRILGYSDEFVRDLERDLLTADLNPRLRAALDYARLMSRANPLPGVAHVRALREHGFGEEATAELAAFAALWVMEVRMTTLAAAPPHPMEGFFDRWWMRAVRPVMGWGMRRAQRNAPIAVVDPARRLSVFDDLIGALGPTPAAASLRACVDAAFGEGALPRRSRVLVGAVIGRALGCPETECRLGALMGPGGPDQAELSAMLNRLDAPWLDDRERAMLSVARDTIRTQQPRLVQRRMLELRSLLEPAEFVDFIGVAAVANAVGRLGMLLERC